MSIVSLRRLLLLGVVLVALLGFADWTINLQRVDAQTKKSDAKADAKKSDQTTDPKKISDAKVKPDVIVAGSAEQIAHINAEIEKKWHDNKLEPAKRCTDFEFIRRASLDIIGRIAKPAEMSEFLNWPAEKRRSMLIEKLLKSDEYSSNFANIFTNLLMTRTSTKLHRVQMQSWLGEEFAKSGADWSKITSSLISASGKTNGDGDAPAVNFILAHLGTRAPGNPAANGQWDAVPVTSRITRLFLGLRTQCTQCHDHPFNDEWKQEHFWGINAFLRQVDTPKGKPGMPSDKKAAEDKQYELIDNATFNLKGLVSYERRSGLVEFTKAAFLDGVKLPAKMEGTRRQELAKRVTSSPFFAKAFVNRMWGHFFGRGFTKEVDDFGDHSPISHPELLDKVGKDWAGKHTYEPRELIRWICNSKAYGLSSQANSSNAKPDAEPFFSRMLLKAMTPEQLFESLMTATDAKEGQTRQTRNELKDKWMTKLVVNFGDDEGNEGTFNGTVVQALLMMNGLEINNAIIDDAGAVSSMLRKLAGTKGAIPRSAQETAVTGLYYMALNRPPTPKEMTRVLDPERMKLGGPAFIDYNFFRGYCQDLFWAMLNSNEFILNH